MRTQARKSLYSLYPKMMDMLAAQVQKSLGKQAKKLNKAQLIKALFDAAPEMHHSLDFQIMSEEHFWDREGSNVVFPDSGAVLDNLLRAKFLMETSEGFTLPFHSFMIAMPNGYQFDGLEIPGFIVTLLPYDELGPVTSTPFTRYVGLRSPDSYGLEDAPPGTRALIISYRDVNGSMAYVRSVHLETKLPAVLKSESLDQFHEITGDYKGAYGEVMKSEKEDLARQFIMLRLVAALGVYNMSTHGDRLVAGFPGGVEPRLNNRPKGQLIRFSTLKNSQKTEAVEGAREVSYRTWHFRQLRDEKYYRNEYANTPPGSRYVFVSDAVVGQKVTAHTQR